MKVKTVFKDKKWIICQSDSGELFIQAKGPSSRGVRPEIRISSVEPGQLITTARGCRWEPGMFERLGGSNALENIGGFSVCVQTEPS